jgi:hypothetical protein
MEPDLLEWFATEGLVRYSASASEDSDESETIEVAHPPLVALGPRDEDFVLPPHPDALRYAGKRLHEMRLQDYNEFLFCWFEVALRSGDVRCAYCGRVLRDEPDLPPTDTWDAIFIEKDLVAWMLVHFDCKRLLAKKLTGVQPFDLTPRKTPCFTLSTSATRH